MLATLKTGRFARVRESIFIKIILVFLLAALATIEVMHVFQHDFINSEALRQQRMRTLSEYGRLTVDSLGTAPSAEKIKDLDHRLHSQLRMEGPDTHIATNPNVITFDRVNKEGILRFSEAGVDIRRIDEYLAVETKRGDIRYLFLLPSESAIDQHSSIFLIPVAALLIILLLCYFAVRWILSPLKEIERGVLEVGSGNLEVRVEQRGSDELGRLARSFNHMTNRVRKMLRSKEQLLLDVSHEFRSPLTRIKVAMELTTPEARNSVLRAVKDLDTMVAELLESARLDDAQGRLKLERVDLANELRELIAYYQTHKPGVRALFSESIQIFCLVDTARIQTALRNILENALKYSALSSNPVEIGVRFKEHSVIVSINDFGEGIPQDDVAQIFEPFYRVDRSRAKATGGYGLGLALSQKIVIAHQGTLTVESEPGHGSTFLMELPKALE